MALAIRVGAATLNLNDAKEARLRAALMSGGVPATDDQILEKLAQALRRTVRDVEESSAVAQAVAGVNDL